MMHTDAPRRLHVQHSHHHHSECVLCTLSAQAKTKTKRHAQQNGTAGILHPFARVIVWVGRLPSGCGCMWIVSVRVCGGASWLRRCRWRREFEGENHTQRVYARASLMMCCSHRFFTHSTLTAHSTHCSLGSLALRAVTPTNVLPRHTDTHTHDFTALCALKLLSSRRRARARALNFL